MAIRKINSRAIADGAVATADLDDNPLTIDSLVVDTTTLVVDATNNHVGFGTATPANPIDATLAAGGDFVARFQNTTSATPYNVMIKDAPSGANGYPLLQVVDDAGTGTYFRVDSGTGAIYTPKMTYFAAKGPASWQTISNGSNTKVSLTTEIIDRAGTYDASNSRFTATVPGYYRFEFHQYARLQGSQGDNSSHWYGGFLVNGSVSSAGATQNIVGYQNDGDYDNFGIHTGIFNLSAGDYVEAYGRAGSASNAEVYGYWSMFTGIQLER